MKKILVSILVCVVMAFAFAGCTDSAATSSVTPTPTKDPKTSVTPAPTLTPITIKETEDFWRYAIEGNEVVIYGYVGVDIYEATVPSKIEGLPVTTITETGFCYKDKRATDGTQHYCDLKVIHIPASVKNISESAFARCTQLEDVTFDSGVDLLLSNGVLYNKSKTILYFCIDKEIESLVIPSTVKTIGGGAFRDCNKLVSITIPGNVEYVYDYAFYDCANLKIVTVSEGVKSMGVEIFTKCFNLETLNLPKSLLIIGPKAVSFTNKLTIWVYEGSKIHEYFQSEEMTTTTGSGATYLDYVKFYK